MMMTTTIDATRLLTLAQSSAPGGAADAGMTALDYVRAGGLIGYVLILLSFVALGMLIALGLTLRRSRLMPDDVIDRIEPVLGAGDIQQAVAICRDPAHDSFLTRVIGEALRRCVRSPFGMLELRSAVEESGQREVDRLYRSVDVIGVLAAVGPMLGLLGTVFGMIGAFATIGQLDGAARSQQLASYMSIALVTTAQGLLVAIPCTIAYALFRRRIETISAEASQLIEGLVAPLEASAGGESKPSRGVSGIGAGSLGVPRARPEAARAG
jgi:biopolymer transport protein ExbB